MSDKTLAKQISKDLLSGCQRFCSSVSIYLRDGGKNSYCSRSSYMENILIGYWLVEVDLSSISESCFTHIGDRTDLVDISWEATATIRSEEIYKSQSYGRSG